MGIFEDTGVDPHLALPSPVVNMLESTWYNPLIGNLEREVQQMRENCPGNIRILMIDYVINWMKCRRAHVYEHGATNIDRTMWQHPGLGRALEGRMKSSACSGEPG